MTIHESEEKARKNFADRLKKAISLSDKTQKEIATQCGISEVTMSRYVNGDRIPKVNILDKVCEVLGCDLAWLLWGTKKKIPTVSAIIEEVAEEICNEYCKYPGIRNEENGDLSGSEICFNCPLSRL